MERRNFLSIPIAAVAAPAATPEEVDLSAALERGFDGGELAKAFVHAFRKNPSIATDPEAMDAWFATAMMRGYDEKYEMNPYYAESIAANSWKDVLGNRSLETKLARAVAANIMERWG